MTNSRILPKWVWRRIDNVRTYLLRRTQRRFVSAGRCSMWAHMLPCECRWGRVQKLHQATNHTLSTYSLKGEMRLWSHNSVGYKVCEYPPRLFHCSPCYDMDDWIVLSIYVASLRLFPYHHTYNLRLPPQIVHLSQSLRSFGATAFHSSLMSMM
jgi:hypothetical protein